MLQLGFGERAKSAGAVRIVQRRAAELGLDCSHFRGKRRWSDEQLKQAVYDSRSWPDLLVQLGLSPDGGKLKPHIQSHAVRLGLDTGHLDRLGHDRRQPAEPASQISELKPQFKFWRVAAGTLAATWFMIRGCAVSFPVEPTVYDLLADTPQGLMRIQVKTTTHTDKNNGWIVGIGHHPDTHAKKQGRLLAYSPDEIDLFFIIDGDMTMYLIPSRAVAGRVTILLRAYKKYIVGNAQGLLGAANEADSAPVPASA